MLKNHTHSELVAAEERRNTPLVLEPKRHILVNTNTLHLLDARERSGRLELYIYIYICISSSSTNHRVTILDYIHITRRLESCRSPGAVWYMNRSGYLFLLELLVIVMSQWFTCCMFRLCCCVSFNCYICSSFLLYNWCLSFNVIFFGLYQKSKIIMTRY